MLLSKDYVAKVDLEHAQQAYQQAKNSYDASKTVVERDMVNLNYAKITSPIDGVIISQVVTLGQTLASNFQTPNLFKIAGDLKQMKIDVGLSETDITKIKEGMPVTFTVTAYPDQLFTGKVQTVNLSPDTTQGVVMYKVEVLANNEELRLLPGMTAYVTIVVSEKKDVLRISAAALRFTPPEKNTNSGLSGLFKGAKNSARSRSVKADTGPNKTIYLLENGVLTPMEVATGATDDAFVEISGTGIAEGSTVAIGIQPKKH
jgi:HlyD family secretion protein